MTGQQSGRRPAETARRTALRSLSRIMMAALCVAAAAAASEPRVSDLVTRPSAPNEQIRHLAQQARLTRGGTKARLERIVDQIFSERDGLGFTYRARPTLTASEAVEMRAGNCLSLVNLVVSIARSADIDAEYVEVEDFETFYRHKGTVVRTTHIIAGIDVGGRRMYVDFLPRRAKPYRQLKPISDRRAAALFYNALATEAMLDIHLDLAALYFRQALAVDDSSAETWNNLAVLERRRGDLDLAIESLNKAHQLDPTLLPAIENLAGMYRRADRLDDARRFEQLALAEKTKNPYFLLQRAVEELERGETDSAEILLKRARRMDPDEPEIHVALGRVELSRGNKREARRLFSQAHAKSKERTGGFQMLLRKKIDRLLAESTEHAEEDSSPE